MNKNSKNNKEIAKSEQINFLLYKTPNGDVKVEVLLNDETIWVTQKAMADLFDAAKSTVSEHLKNIFTSGELSEKAVVRNFRTTASDGKNYNTKFYNLDAIIAVGYRVNSRKATLFRIWATKVLKEYIKKGFILDDERLKQAKTVLGKDYFDELLERVQSIRASERRIYLKITDIFAECAIDYDPNSKITKDFYAMVQNKFHYAITGKTAAEIIYEKADAEKPNMGLTTWKNAPRGRILKSDTEIAKNYLSEKQIKKLERTVSSYFDYIENQIEIRRERLKPFTMEELAFSVNRFLEFNNFKVLDTKGSVSHQNAIKKAYDEYDKFNKYQPIDSDFEKIIKKLKK